MKEDWVGKESWKDQQGIVSDGLKIPKYNFFPTWCTATIFQLGGMLINMNRRLIILLFLWIQAFLLHLATKVKVANGSKNEFTRLHRIRWRKWVQIFFSFYLPLSDSMHILPMYVQLMCKDKLKKTGLKTVTMLTSMNMDCIGSIYPLDNLLPFTCWAEDKTQHVRSESCNLD